MCMCCAHIHVCVYCYWFLWVWSMCSTLHVQCTPLIYTILIVQCRTFHIYVIDVSLWFQTTAFGSNRNRTVTLYGYRSSIALTMFARTISDFLSIEKLHPSVGFVCKIMNVVICIHYTLPSHRDQTQFSIWLLDYLINDRQYGNGCISDKKNLSLCRVFVCCHQVSTDFNVHFPLNTFIHIIKEWYMVNVLKRGLSLLDCHFFLFSRFSFFFAFIPFHFVSVFCSFIVSLRCHTFQMHVQFAWFPSTIPFPLK